MAHYDLLSPMFPVQMLDLHKRLSRGEVHAYTRADSCLVSCERHGRRVFENSSVIFETNYGVDPNQCSLMHK